MFIFPTIPMYFLAFASCMSMMNAIIALNYLKGAFMSLPFTFFLASGTGNLKICSSYINEINLLQSDGDVADEVEIQSLRGETEIVPIRKISKISAE